MKVVLAATVATAVSWSSDPTSILPMIAVIALIWQVGRSMRRIENASQSLGERMVADHTRSEEQLDARLMTLGERMDSQQMSFEDHFDTEVKAFRDEVRYQHAETRRMIEAVLLRIGGG